MIFHNSEFDFRSQECINIHSKIESEMAWLTLPDASKTLPRRLEDPPRSLQDASKNPQDAAKTPLDS